MGKFSISGEEALHILVSVITISLAFTLFGGDFTPYHFLLILITVGTAFIFHELGHKFVAIRYGARAQYRAWTSGLFLALVVAFLTKGTFVFAAPGAVYIYGSHLTREQNGRIALAGPLVNLALVIIFFLLSFTSLPKEFVSTGLIVNLILGAFNMIPFPPLDGAKVAEWSQKTWLSFFLVFCMLFLLVSA